MKKHTIVVLAILMALPVAMAQTTNQAPALPEEDQGEFSGKTDLPERSNRTMEERNERKYQFMDKALADIGLNEEERVKIHELQAEHRLKMKEISEQVTVARQKLSGLQEKGASLEELDAAIDEISQAQGQQLKILVRNRIEMEKLLGPEKNKKFMELARTKFQEHGRRSGRGLPPRPDQPPLPGSSPYGRPPMPDQTGDQIPPPPAE